MGANLAIWLNQKQTTTPVVCIGLMLILLTLMTFVRLINHLVLIIDYFHLALHAQ